MRLPAVLVMLVMDPPPSRGLLRKVLEVETLALDFEWLERCVKWCSPACTGLVCVWINCIGCVNGGVVDWKINCDFADNDHHKLGRFEFADVITTS